MLCGVCLGDDVELKRKSYFSVILVNVEMSFSPEMIFIVSTVALSLYIVPSPSDMLDGKLVEGIFHGWLWRTDGKYQFLPKFSFMHTCSL